MAESDVQKVINALVGSLSPTQVVRDEASNTLIMVRMRRLSTPRYSTKNWRCGSGQRAGIVETDVVGEMGRPLFSDSRTLMA